MERTQLQEAANDRHDGLRHDIGPGGNGTLTKDEAKSMPRVAKHFDAIDRDKDGTVSEQEIHDYMKAQHSKK